MMTLDGFQALDGFAKGDDSDLRRAATVCAAQIGAATGGGANRFPWLPALIETALRNRDARADGRARWPTANGSSYRPGQPRVPKGTPGMGGRWVGPGGVSGAGKARKINAFEPNKGLKSEAENTKLIHSEQAEKKPTGGGDRPKRSQRGPARAKGGDKEGGGSHAARIIRGNAAAMLGHAGLDETDRSGKAKLAELYAAGIEVHAYDPRRRLGSGSEHIVERENEHYVLKHTSGGAHGRAITSSAAVWESFRSI